MKKKLNTVFVLIGIALSGVIIFQLYWTSNAYQVNKAKFDTTVNKAMQNAMEDCKKDYFDSIRKVLVKHLSPPDMLIRIDTIRSRDTAYTNYAVLFLNKTQLPGEPYIISKSNLAFYRKKIGHPVTLPELFTEISFYEPILMEDIKTAFGVFGMGGVSFTSNDMRRHPDLFRREFFNGKPLPAYILNDKTEKPLPDFYQHIRDLAILAYFKRHISKTSHKIVNKIDSTQEGKARYLSGYQAGLNAAKARLQNIFANPVPKLPDSLKTKIVVGRHKNGNTLRAKNKIVNNTKADVTQNIRLMGMNTVYDNALNYRYADSIKLYGYLENELAKLGINSPFQLTVSAASMPTATSNIHYTETNDVDYKYYGFKLFGIGLPEFFMRAKFFNPQYRVLKGMLLTILLSLFLILFVIFAFNYIIKTFIEQKKLADLKDDFINNMTHELKTPIATITVAIEGLQKFNALNDPEKTQRYLQTSRNELTRLNDLVTKVLDIATFENKEIELTKQSINVDELVNELIASETAKTIKTVDITFINKDELTAIYADKVHFKNVMINLIDNAIKYSVEPVLIVINCYKIGNYAVFSVKDNGIGIPTAHTGQIFDKFHRVPTGNLHNVKGTGLGLSYVKYIIEAHGGTIAVKSEIDKGSEFIVSIPLSNG